MRSARSLVLAVILSGVVCPGTARAQTWMVVPPATPLSSLAPLRLAPGMAGLVGEIWSACYREGIEEASIFIYPDTAKVPSAWRSVVTGARGVFVRDSLPPGRYRVRVAMIGYAPATRTLDLVAGRVDTVRATMEIADAAAINADCLVRAPDGTIGLAGCPFRRPPCR